MKKYLFISLLMILISTGCVQKKEPDDISNRSMYNVKSEEALPDNAIITDRLGNGWIIFELQEKRFLFREYALGNTGYSCITQIKE